MSDQGAQAKGLHVLDRKVFAKGEKIFREGDNGSRAYIIQRGRVDIVKDIDGNSVVVGSVGPGGIFGEMALIDKEPRMASAVVADYCVCIIVTSAMFRKKLRGLDPFLGGILRILVENIRSIQNANEQSKTIEAMFGDASAPDGIEDAMAVLPGEEADSEAGGAFEIA